MSQEATDDGADAMEEDDRGSGGEVKSGLETLSENCIGLSSSQTSHCGQRQPHAFQTPGRARTRLNQRNNKPFE